MSVTCEPKVALHSLPAESIAAPPKAELFGVGVSCADAAAVVDVVAAWARERRSAVVDFMGVHGLTTAADDPQFQRCLNDFDVVACDGQPIRWALDYWYGAALGERVYGPHTMLKLCGRAAAEGTSIYLYGGKEEVLDLLQAKLLEEFPRLRIAGSESPPFRALSSEELDATFERINSSGAGMVFLGLGCPKQELFAVAHRERIHAVQLCVGAAFDFIAGVLPMAPPWMQRSGLEWLYRLIREPRRLWKRYAIGNSKFLGMCLRQFVRGGGPGRPAGPANA